VLKAFFKDTVLYGLAAVLPRVINLFLVAVFTMVLGKVDFSDQTTWYVYAAFINVILTMGIETSFFRYYTSESNKQGVLATSSFLLMLTSGIFLIFGLFFAGSVSSFLGFEEVILVKLLVIITVLDTLVVIPFAYLRVTGRPVRYMIVKLLNVLILFLVTVYFLIVVPKFSYEQLQIIPFLGDSTTFTPGVVHIILANLIASLLTVLILLPEWWKVQWKVDKVILVKLLTYGWPIMVGGIAYAINENLDKLIIQELIDKESNGVYAACYKLGVFMTLYITAFRLGAEPFFFRQAHTVDAKQKYSKVMTWFVIFGCICMVCVTLYIDLFAGIIIRNTMYREGLTIVPILLLANLFSGIYNNLSIWYKLTDKTKFGMYISIIGAVITIGSLYFFVPLLGILGGAVATLFTYGIMMIISWYLGQKHYPVPYELAKIWRMIAISAIVCAISFYVYRANFMINTLILIAYFGTLYLLLKSEIQDLIVSKK